MRYRYLALLFGAAIQVAIVPAIQTGDLETPRLKYILPEGFAGWACFDFGVNGAPPLKRDGKGVYLLEPIRDAIVPTSSLPSLKHLTFASEVIGIVEGQEKPVTVDEIRQRDEYDSERAVSRHCSFFGSASAARTSRRPPTLTESRIGTAPLLQKFEFSKGSVCDFRQIPRVCLDAKDVAKRRIHKAIVESLRGYSITAGAKCDAFDGIVVRYRTDWALQTHGNSRGSRYGFAEVRREQRGKSTIALATWSDTDGGEADAVARRFDRDLAEFFRQATTATCTK
jgi:hypothetical protein